MLLRLTLKAAVAEMLRRLPLLLPPMPPMLQSPSLCCHCNALAEATLSQETTAAADDAVLSMPTMLPMSPSLCCHCNAPAEATLSLRTIATADVAVAVTADNAAVAVALLPLRRSR